MLTIESNKISSQQNEILENQLALGKEQVEISAIQTTIQKLQYQPLIKATILNGEIEIKNTGYDLSSFDVTYVPILTYREGGIDSVTSGIKYYTTEKVISEISYIAPVVLYGSRINGVLRQHYISKDENIDNVIRTFRPNNVACHSSWHNVNIELYMLVNFTDRFEEKHELVYKFFLGGEAVKLNSSEYQNILDIAQTPESNKLNYKLISSEVLNELFKSKHTC